MGFDRSAFLSAYDALLDRWPVPVDPLDLATPYGTTRVNAAGPPGAPPLLLLHGGGATAAGWWANVGELARTARVFAVDRIGEAGRSDPAGRPRPRTVEDLHGWLDAVLDALGVDRADLCGHSYGGWIALSYALRRPARVSRLALLDPTGCFTGFRLPYLLHAAPLLARPSERRARAFLAWETGGAPLDPDWVRLYGLAAAFPAARPVTGPRPGPAALAALDAPCLVLPAADSRSHDPHTLAARATALLPRARVRTLAGVSHHGLPHLHPAALNAELADFLAR
ncbi:pimeloyl-ACP methyl ester carboxylesterase [Kitasatospora sp. SolWspMP-SS2h]|uniref:alpha/beta fold hydrolase n=1 Tax=Kitasatospora sp. SolWspMP-SS2h TaxID=1305729 RepID=UPI000DB9F79A|nr:alpha/beta hydrolase [Kitasatospora sp. SolWspMP-SS2h]RAJ33175.1 pimeloyl-ACP methyl ester carboxylesterase [Kitasatospora sp. SolWspMP-SS2h]